MRQINTRNDFGILAQDFYKLGIGAEIGVAMGTFSKLVSDKWNGKILCVDIWKDDSAYEFTKNRLKDEKYVLIRGDSADVSKTIEDNSLDWIYIDTEHDYDSIKRDYDAWFPKVRKCGLISGHDYGDNGFGVKKFVDELNKDIYITTDDISNGQHYETWYFQK